MQVDEEIGKVAQATPILICNICFPLLILIKILAKAIELFLQHLINAIIEDSRAQNITRVSPSLMYEILFARLASNIFG